MPRAAARARSRAMAMRFVDDVVALFLGADAGHAAVEVHALLRGGDVFLRDGGGDGEVRRAPGRLFHGLALLLQDGLL